MSSGKCKTVSSQAQDVSGCLLLPSGLYSNSWLLQECTVSGWQRYIVCCYVQCGNCTHIFLYKILDAVISVVSTRVSVDLSTSTQWHPPLRPLEPQVFACLLVCLSVWRVIAVAIFWLRLDPLFANPSTMLSLPDCFNDLVSVPLQSTTAVGSAQSPKQKHQAGF